MPDARYVHQLRDLTPAHVADACLRLDVDVRVAPSHVVPIDSTAQVRGRACPVRHFGSVDVFLEAIDVADPGDVLVIDNDGRTDEACIGDLVAVEAHAAGLAGMVVWGLHRDTRELLSIGLPVFSIGATPVGPRRLEPRGDDAFSVARIGEVAIEPGDVVIGDADGVIFIADDRLDEVIDAARSIRDIEHRQASEVRGGRSLRDQLSFAEYRQKASKNPEYTLRQHLIDTGGAIET